MARRDSWQPHAPAWGFQELLLVLEGTVRLILDEEEHEMHSGDSIEYRSSSTHCVVNDSGAAARVLWIISPPSL